MDTYTNDQIEELIKRIRLYVMNVVTESRYEHSVRTAQTCELLCRRYGLDVLKGYLIGIGHDMCKNMNDRLLVSLASKDGNPITEIEAGKPSLLHGRAAAVKLKNDFGIIDPELLEAVANHTFGVKNACNYTKVLYVADKVEPGRKHITKEYTDKLLEKGLDEMTAQVLEENVMYIRKKGHSVSSSTLLFYKTLTGRDL